MSSVATLTQLCETCLILFFDEDSRQYTMAELIKPNYTCNLENEDADFSFLHHDWDLIIKSRDYSHGTSQFLKEFASKGFLQ